MKILSNYIIAIVLILPFTVKAQAIFIESGKIEFEKKVNLLNMIKSEFDNDRDRTWFDMIQKMIPPVNTSYFDLSFKNNKTLFLPGKEFINSPKAPSWTVGPATENVVYSDYTTQEQVSLKEVFDNTFLMKDSLHHIDWKMVNETRNIAGFTCRKAVAKMFDSVYVIAFFTEQITVPGGPESFNGLPGMILGLAIPRLHTTWYATKVEAIAIKDTEIMPPKKGKKMNFEQLKDQLKKSMKDWGKEGGRNLLQAVI